MREFDDGRQPTLNDISSELEVDEHPHPVLMVISGPQLGERWIIDRPMQVGATLDADYRLLDPKAPGVLFDLVPEVDGLRVIRCAGTTLERPKLQAGEELRIGDTRLRLEVHRPVEVAFDRAVQTRVLKEEGTGLQSRTRLALEAAFLLEHAMFTGQSFFVVLADVDGLKKINDRYGHLVGAQTLNEIGRRLRALLCSTAAAARYGGDEFVFVGIDNTPPLNLVLQTLAGPFSIPGRDFQVTMTTGVSRFPDEGLDFAGLFRLADDRLLVNKQPRKS